MLFILLLIDLSYIFIYKSSKLNIDKDKMER